MNHLINRPWYKFYRDPKELKVPEISLYSILKETVKLYGERVAIIYEHTNTTYSELKDKVDRLAAAWKELGFQKDERIGLMVANHPDYIISYYAAQALGLIVVQINPMYTPRELLYILSDCQVSYLVADPDALKTVRQVCDSYKLKNIFVSQMRSDDSSSEFLDLDKLKKHSYHLEKQASISTTNDVAVIQYTGGTTGKMKGAMLTHYNLIANLMQGYSLLKEKMLPGQEVILTAVPLYHVYGMNSIMNLGVYIGATLLLIKKFQVEDILEQIKEYRPTFLPGVPKMYNAFVNHPHVERYGLDCFKLCSCGSSPLPVEVIKRFEHLTGAEILEAFGLSEASPLTHRNPLIGMRKVGSIGIPVPGTDSIIVDDNNQELPSKCIGELLIKGPQVMKGYWNNEQETNRSLQNGWLYTGDLAMMDEDGYFYIVGRKKEMIIVGGFNIYPQEVEGVLYEHPDVKEAAVVGIPNLVNGETVKAYVVPKDGCQIDLEELRGQCYLKLTRYKVPKEFEIRESLPRNTVGKLLKRLLVQEEQEKGARENAN
ncbi:long-chain-fatty-acid--CoA ligase [Peribacillus phoenicis]|uniref:long-chain-fatty-acid--CoA ligase n=1 Tax=unclassified Peribacillus TaxID=2675266 RepID=UPI0039A1F19A